MEYTEHYAIAKHGPFGEGEALSAYSIVNVAMDTIDDILFELKSLIDALEGRMDTAEENITNIYTQIDRIDQNIDQIETSVTEIQQDITNIQNDITNINQSITNITNEMQESNTHIWRAIENVVNKIVGGGTVDEETGDITWTVDGSIAIGNINLYSGSGIIKASTSTLEAPGENDVEVQ